MRAVVTSAAFLPPALPRGKNLPGRSSRWSGLASASVFAVAAVGTLVIAHGMADGAIPFPGCGFKKLTGLACPGCGGTRTLAALLAHEPLAALALNPAVALAWFAVIAGVPVAAIDAVCARGRGAAWLSSFASTRLAARLLVAAIVANWIFLLAVGR